MDFQELGEQKARNGSSSAGSSGSKGLLAVQGNRAGGEMERWGMQRGLGATLASRGSFPYITRSFPFSCCILSLRSEPRTQEKENGNVFGRGQCGRGDGSSVDSSVLSL